LFILKNKFLSAKLLYIIAAKFANFITNYIKDYYNFICVLIDSVLYTIYDIS